MRQRSGAFVRLEAIAALARKLEEALLLDGPEYRRLIEAPVRQPRCIGARSGPSL